MANPACKHQYFDITVDASNVLDDIFHVLVILRPNWKKEEIVQSSFSTGSVNSMTCFSHEDDKEKQDAFVVRVYGYTDGIIVSRDKEFLSLQIAEAAGCFPGILAAFKNGLIYPHQPGRIMAFGDLRERAVISQVSHLLYDLHHVDIDSLSLVDRKGNPATYKRSDLTLTEVEGFMKNIPECLNDPGKNIAYQDLRKILTNGWIMRELEFVRSILSYIEIPLTLNHMDLHPKNMIINDTSGQICFIDYEATCFSYEYHDMNRLFLNKMMYETQWGTSSDLEPFPSDEIRHHFLSSYLQSKLDAAGETDRIISAQELELVDIQHRVVEIVTYLQFIVMYMSFLNAPVVLDVWKVLNLFKEQYFLKKDELPRLKERYVLLLSKSS